jgi:alkyl hydroperoxide reductase subunit AhpC
MSSAAATASARLGCNAPADTRMEIPVPNVGVRIGPQRLCAKRSYWSPNGCEWKAVFQITLYKCFIPFSASNLCERGYIKFQNTPAKTRNNSRQADIEEVLTMALSIGDVAPDFEAQTTEGKIKFHDWIGDSWAVLFSHPKDFTPVCTTELGYMAKIKPEFDKRGVKIIGLSVDPVDRHAEWSKDIKETQGFAPNYPMIGDTDFNVSKLYGMLPAATSGDPLKRTPNDNQTVRNVFVIGPDKKVKLILVYPMSTGRNFDEVLRVIDSLQLTAKHRVSTPAQWKQGEDVILGGAISDDEAKKLYPNGWKAPKPYIRIVPQPK